MKIIGENPYEVFELEHFSKESVEEYVNHIDEINEVIQYNVFENCYIRGTYLLSAISADNEYAVRLLLEKGANPNFESEEYQIELPLRSVFVFTGSTAEEAKNQLHIAKLLLDYGADPEKKPIGEKYSVVEMAEDWTDLVIDTSSEYDNRFNSALLGLMSAKINGTLGQIDMDELLSDFDDEK